MRECLVVGGSGALGGAIVVELGRRGARVGVHCRTRRDRASDVARACVAAGGRGYVVQADISVPGGAAALLADCIRECGSVPRELVVAAGITEDAPLTRTPEESWDRVIRVNLTGVALLLKEICGVWCAGGGGHAVLLGSYAGIVGRVGGAAYAASEVGLIGLARSVARELGGDGVRINVAIPPFVEEGLGGGASPAFAEAARAASITGRTGTVEQFARFVAGILDVEGVSGQVLGSDARVW